ncbi:LysR family transcriptional regulator [Telluria mixta]|uniref:LysR family transcriptional regulator n=1 Tax=Telluria mixta TaxID=34071 RepID=A0ABT2C1E3_9BURK|nr:LysR family transcriptional regulator [Telluria mixta]MCS0631197.1 LysR family transcriptional regulator [Telluria mixta]WEM95736.1 LysR family transcriptional regulator [Telluria mixta]
MLDNTRRRVSDEPLKIDLNLLNVFDVVMTERNVTHAAERLGLSQPAVSNVLNRLRAQFQDQLFVKAARGVDPTPKAIALWSEIHGALKQLYRTVDPNSFCAEHADISFRVSIADSLAALLTPYLYRRIHAAAPNVKIVFVPPDPDLNTPRLMRGEIDFTLGVDPPRASTLQSARICSETYVVTARKGHPLFDEELTLESICAARHLAVNLTGEPNPSSIFDEALTELGMSRQIYLTVNQFLVAASVLQDSDLIAVLPSRLVMAAVKDGKISVAPLPMKLPDKDLYLSWHKRSNTMPALLWLKQQLIEATEHLNEEFHEIFPLP